MSESKKLICPRCHRGTLYLQESETNFAFSDILIKSKKKYQLKQDADQNVQDKDWAIFCTEGCQFEEIKSKKAMKNWLQSLVRKPPKMRIVSGLIRIEDE